MSEPGPIGQHLRELRLSNQPPLTQRDLAERSGISIDVIQKLEQGSKQTARVTTLHRLARALDVNVSALLGESGRVNTEHPGPEAGVVAIRRAILQRSPTPVDQLEPDVAGIEQAATFNWGSYWAGRYDNLISALPSHLSTTRAVHNTIGSPRTALALADAYAVTSSTLVHLGQIDLAYLAMERAQNTAETGDDPLYRLALSGWMSWLMLHPTATLDEAEHLAARAADDLHRTFSAPAPDALCVWGSLLLSAATAAARRDDIDRAEDFLTEARHAATRLTELGFSSHRAYESTFGAAQVTMQAIDIAVVTDRPGHALDQARNFFPDELPIAAQARHLADRASALTAMDKHDEAVAALLAIEQLAPKWIHYQRYPRTIIRELVERERRGRSSQLRELAERVGALSSL